ncbi:MAG: hypothetical protein IH991_13865 [Planctomycetes bacterium]|nr:hypothetical protein [Planctomycetota bacterium]
MPATIPMTVHTASLANEGHVRQRIELKEWESKEYWLSPRALADLARCESKVLSVQVLPSGATKVTAGPFVGRLRLGSCDVVLRPKRPIPSLLTLLAEVHELTHLVPELAGYTTTPEIVDLLVQIFLRQVDELVRNGLKRTYVNREEELVAIRGRVDVRRTFALHMRARPLAWCSYEDFTLDSIENRALLATLVAVASNGSILQARRRVAHKLMGDFVSVQEVAMLPRDVGQIDCDRLSAHYEPVLRLAQIILASMGLANDFGGVGTNGFMLNMNTLFELFIYRRLRRLLGEDGISVLRQQTAAFDEDRQAEVRPDLLIQSHGGRRIVADTKYKDKKDPEPGDLYQMLTYCRVLRVRHGILITIGDRAPRRYIVRDGETTIEVVPVNLDGSLLDVDRSIMSLADQLRERLLPITNRSTTEEMLEETP